MLEVCFSAFLLVEDAFPFFVAPATGAKKDVGVAQSTRLNSFTTSFMLE